MATDNNMEKPESKCKQLVDVVFSWSLSDVLNKNLYKGKVAEIPKTFSSVSEYTNSFVYPLIEETHADLLSKILGLNRCPTAEIRKVQKSKDFKLPKLLLYTIVLTKREGSYVPEGGDLIALTDVKPKSVDDLKRPNKSYIIALVQGMEIRKSKYKLFVLSSKPINLQQEVEGDIEKDSTSYSVEDLKHFAVYLTNLTTNIRISKALYCETQEDKLKLIKNVLQSRFFCKSHVEERCDKCSDRTTDLSSLNMREALKSFQLDSSQEAAVLSCLAVRKCRHQNTIKLLWGPPGTGKTKTVGSLLCMLLRMKCRTLTCAPTNIAVLGVTKRVMSLLRYSLPYNVYGLGDVVLFGNRERMKIDDCEDLQDIFLDDRAEILADCLAPFSGWNGISEWMIRFLEDLEVQYELYRKENLKGDGEGVDKDKKEEDLAHSSQVKEAMKKKNWKTLIDSTLKGEKRPLNGEITTKVANKHPTKQKVDETDSEENIMTYEQFVTKGFGFLQNRLVSCIENLCTHMPTRFISFGALERMIGLARSLKRFGQLLKQTVDTNISEEAEFGRSLFERLASLGHKKHLLNVQYRMHPSISQFPNKEFYDKQVLDGGNVKSIAYEKRFLQGSMYGSYSFINVTSGKEEFDRSQSRKNLMEVAIAAEIIANLFKVLGALIELRQYDSIFNMGSLLFIDAKWQVKFSDMFLDRIGRFFNPEICKEVAFLLVKLSSGWRQPQKDGNTKVDIEGTWPLLVKYNVTKNLRLIWAVDIVVQNSRYIQVLKIWDILPAVKIGELAKILMQKEFDPSNYMADKLRDRYKLVPGKAICCIEFKEPTCVLVVIKNYK
ncbi:hypothetical protein L6452_10161 [Arctium lappa]|uniref:Uncharacterized protein n=1 Tax=Arctium lappa TaxID=4217 RepID=A0ACB9DMV4_ARCLA|nr:hypothetical protein L6452_10161 [Arctium lappa]